MGGMGEVPQKGFLTDSPCHYLKFGTFFFLLCDSSSRMQLGRRCWCVQCFRVKILTKGEYEQPGLVEGVPASDRSVGTGWSLRSLANQTILQFYDSLHITEYSIKRLEEHRLKGLKVTQQGPVTSAASLSVWIFSPRKVLSSHPFSMTSWEILLLLFQSLCGVSVPASGWFLFTLITQVIKHGKWKTD